MEQAPVSELAQARGYERYLGSSVKGEAAIDWSDRQARAALLAGIVADADRLLELSRQAQGELPEDSDERQRIVAAAELLGQLLLQDVERAEGGVSLKDGVSRDRMMSVHDPEMRHGHKSSSRRFDGHKAAIVVDTDSQLITAVDVLPGNAPDNLGALELVEESEANTGVSVAEAMGDAAYGDGDTRQAFADAGRTLIARVPGRPNRTHLPKEDFHIELEAGSCTCPAGNVTRTMVPAGRRTGQTGRTYRLEAFRFDAAVCGVCPLRSQCVAAKPYGTNGATAPAGSAVTAGPRPAAERGLCRVPPAPRGSGAPAGAAGPTGNPPVSLLRPHQNPVPTVPGGHGGQPDPGGRQSRYDGRNRLRSQCRQRPGRWNGQLRHRMARANLDPHPARIGLTDQIPLPNKGFPAGFLAMNIAVHAAKSGQRCGIFSLDMTRQQLALRVLAAESSVDFHRLRLGVYTYAEEQSIITAIGRLSDLPVYVDDSRFQTLAEMRSKARRLSSRTDWTSWWSTICSLSRVALA